MHFVTGDLKKPLLLSILIVLGVVTGSLPAVIPAKFLPYFIGVCLLSGVTLLTLIRPVLLLYFVILTSAMAGLFRSFETLSFGATSLTVSGFRWLLVAGILAFVAGINIHRIRVPRHYILFVIFGLWAIVTWLCTSLVTTGLKDIFFYSLPPLMGVYTLFVFSNHKKSAVENIEKFFLYSVFIPLLMYIILIFSGLVYITESGPRGVLVPRAVATYLLVVLSFGLAHWRYAINEIHRFRGAFVSLLALGIIVFTLSRTATVIALLLLVICKIKPFKLWKILPSGILVVILSVSVLLVIPSLRARLFHVPPSNLSEAWKYLITSGRNKMWPTAFNHALEKPILGWGPGSARLLVATVMTNRKEYHPHNEYLQVFHDTGIIGLALLLLAWLHIFLRYRKKWRFAHLSGDTQQAKWSMAAFLCIVVVLINAIVDNTLHYPFVIAPVFIIIGCADFLNSRLSLPLQERQKSSVLEPFRVS